MGTREGLDDIFPRTRIGATNSTEVRIKYGRLWYGSGEGNVSISSMAKRNWTTETKDIDEIQENSFFNMEPGRCIHHGLFATSYAHLSTNIPIDTTCFSSECYCY